MDVSTGKVLVKAGLCLGFLFRLLLWRAKMGLRARLEAMESHSTAQLYKKHRILFSRSGLVSLCSPDITATHPTDGCLSILEDSFYKQKESLGRFVASSQVLDRPKRVRFGLDHEFLLNNDHTPNKTNCAGMQQKASTSADVLPSFEHFTAAASPEMPSPTHERLAASILCSISREASTYPSTCSVIPSSLVSCEPATPPGPSDVSVASMDQQAHKEITSAALETLCEASAAVKPDQQIHRGATSAALETLSEASAAVTVQEEVPVYKQLLERIRANDLRNKELNSEIEVKEALLENLRRTKQALFEQRTWDTRRTPTVPISAAFIPLSQEEEEEVSQALNGANRHEVLVQHEPSNIDLSRAALQCLKPGAWLNDEVINLYLELLKERERREQKDYLKCHFFNTFFFNKLFKDAHSYDYKAVRRWTTLKKLGYSLLECDKIFVPIHKDIHWCLAVINLREKKLQYLDSLKGQDRNALQALARYIRDEAKDKGAESVDTSTWELDCPKDIPEQRNGCDCGVFMIKYADFLSRGDELKFTQKNMDYFRKRTVLELLQLNAR